jgi:hypothetical protein
MFSSIVQVPYCASVYPREFCVVIVFINWALKFNYV